MVRRVVCRVCFLCGALCFAACALTDSVAMYGLGLLNLVLSGFVGLECRANKGPAHDDMIYKYYYMLLACEVYMILSYFGRHGFGHRLQFSFI